MTLTYKKIQIDKDLKNILPPLSGMDQEMLRKSLLENGFDERFGKIKIWIPNDDEDIAYIVDGFNRYDICKNEEIEIPLTCYEIMHFTSKASVIKWIYENQLARRNLSEMDRYEIAEAYSTFLQKMAKKNQSDGGKGESNLTRMNTRKEKAKIAGVSDGNYYKLSQIEKFGDTEIIQQLRQRKISVDRAYQKIKKPRKKVEKEDIPKEKIKKIDDEISMIEKKIGSLNIEKDCLLQKRLKIFSSLDLDCELKYEFTQEMELFHRKCRFYAEIDGYRQVFLECIMLFKVPLSSYIDQIPKKFKTDFLALWEKAYEEDMIDQAKRESGFNREYNNSNQSQEFVFSDREVDKPFLKKCYHELAKCFHPDNGNGNADDMQKLNKLKAIWEI